MRLPCDVVKWDEASVSMYHMLSGGVRDMVCPTMTISVGTREAVVKTRSSKEPKLSNNLSFEV